MKHLFLYATLLLSTTVFAQFQDRFLSGSTTSEGNFYEIQAQGEAYYSAVIDTNKGNGKKSFDRWKYFWSKRVDAPNSSDGSYRHALNALYSIMNNPVCPSSTFSNWSNISPGVTPFADQALGIITAVEFNPVNPTTTFYAGTPTSGLWKTTDGGISWICLTESLRLPGLGIQDIAIDPTNTNIIYIATGITRMGSYGIGVMKSTDGGLSWNTTGLSFDPAAFQFVVTRKIMIDPTNSNTLFALTDYDIYKTTDAGTTWVSIKQLNPSTRFPLGAPCQYRFSCGYNTRKFIDIEMKPGDVNTIYVSTNDEGNAPDGCVDDCNNVTTSTTNGGAELWKTTDGGNTWNELTPVSTGTSPLFVSNPNIRYSNAIGIAVTPAEPNSVYLVYGTVPTPTSSISYFHKSTDGGVTWQSPIPMTNVSYYHYSLNVGFFGSEFEVSPTDANVMYTGMLELFKSSNGGTSWSQITDYWSDAPHINGGHADIRALTIRDVAGNDVLLVGNDGGVGYSTNSGTSWANVSQTLTTSEFYGLAGTEANPDLIVAGAQDNGLWTYNSGTWTYSVRNVGDAYECEIDFNTPPNCYGQGNGSNLKKSINGNNSWVGITNPPGATNHFSALYAHPTNNTIYSGRHDVFKSSTSSISWTNISSFTSNFGIDNNKKLTDIAVSPSNPSVIYAAYGNVCWGCAPSQEIFRTMNNGTTWVDITTNFPSSDIFRWLPVSSMAVNPVNEAEIWVTTSGFSNGERVWHSTDYGDTWTDYSNNLSNFPTHRIVCANGATGDLYLATDLGVFYTNNEIYPTQGWTCFSNNLPIVIATDLEVNKCANLLRVSTFGRGIWESPLAPSSTAISATASPNSFCSPQSSIVSVNLPNPTSTYNWYDAAVGGNFLGTGTSYITPVLSTTTTYYVEETNSFCTSARTPVDVTVLSPDLYIADSPVDIGNEPDAETTASFGNVFWNSSDIWIRQINDGFVLANQVSEPIEYTSGIPNYIYVRVKNKGLCPQTADLRVYWAKASTGLSWSSQWDNYNTTYAGCAASLYGDEITPSTNITVPAQSEQIFEIPWEPKNPDDYNCFVDPFHFCLLGRIETTTVAPYGMTFPEGSSVWSNTVDNNNIAWKNVIVNNNNPGKFEPFGTTIVRNVDEKANFINLNFASQKDDIGQHLIDFKRIQLYCSKDFIKRWAEGGKRGKDIVMVNDSVVEILSANATMENIFLRYNEIGAVSLALETKKDPVLSNDKYFNFDIIQYSRGEKIPQGGQTYQIKKGVSRKDCLTPAHEVSKIILGNQVYSDSILITGNITVPYGATLNFKKATVMLAENASINVMPGGKLIIDASRLESSCIGKKWAGIDVKGAPAFQNPLIIQNSFITGSDSPLSLDKTQGILISRSTFLGDNIGTAIVMNKMKDFKISENTFSNFVIGIKTTNTSAADVKSIIEKNIFLNVKIALDFTQDKHTKLDVKCNRFSYTDYAILSDQTLLKDQGVISEGAGNEFISNSTLTNNKLQHTNGNSPKYYYDPSQPITSGMNVPTLLSTTDRVCYTYSFDTSSTISLQRLSALSTQEEVIPMEVISVYSVPNPNTGKSTIFYNLGGEKQGELVIMDIYGKIIRQIKITSESNKIDVDYNGYATGVYLISLKNSKGDLTNYKMIIEK